MVRPRAGRAPPLVLPAREQPVFLSGGPRRSKFPDQHG